MKKKMQRQLKLSFTVIPHRETSGRNPLLLSLTGSYANFQFIYLRIQSAKNFTRRRRARREKKLKINSAGSALLP
jgi:hypothetical protein